MHERFPMKKWVINLTLSAANLIGMYFYIRNASLAWVIPEERGLSPALAGSAMVWGLGALPVAIIFLLIDGAWWYVVASRRHGRGVVLSASLLWTIAIIFDFSHH
jgi:hypothetical protein